MEDPSESRTSDQYPVVYSGYSVNASELARNEFSMVSQNEGEGKDNLIEYDEHGNVKKAPGQATLMSCIVNLANTILGAGILGLPHAFASSGWVLGIILLCAFACLSGFGLHLLATVSVERFGETRDATFYKVASQAFQRGALVIDVAVAIKCFGVATSYLIVVGDLLPVALKSMGLSGLATNRQLIITVLTVVVVAPLCALKKLDALRFTSALSIGMLLFVTIVIVIYALEPSLNDQIDSDDKGKTTNFVANRDTLKILTIFIFGYTCHQNIFSVCNELKDLTHARVNTVIGTSVGSAWVLYMIIAISGYATFGDKITADALEDYPDAPLITTVRVFISLLVVLSFPLQCFPCRYSTEQILTNMLGEPSSPHVAQRRWWMITITILVLSWFISMVVTNLGVVLAVVGATGSTTISFILPGFVYYRLAAEWTVKRVLAFGLFCFGCIVIPSALTFIFL